MPTVWEALVAAGPAGVAVALLAVSAPVVVLTIAAASALGVRVPALGWWLLPLALVVLGQLGTLSALDRTWHALVEAPPEARAALATDGVARALSPSTYTGQLAGWLLLVLALFGAAAPLVRRGPTTRATPRHAVAPLLLSAAALAATLVTGDGAGRFARIAPYATAIAGLSITLASWQTSTRPRAARRLAAGRGIVATCALGGLLLLTLAHVDQAWALRLSGAASADAQALAHRLDAAVAEQAAVWRLGGAGLVPLAAAATLAVAPVVRAASTLWSSLSMAVVVLLVGVGPVPLRGFQQDATERALGPAWMAAHGGDVAARVGRLPRVDGERGAAAGTCVTWWDRGGWLGRRGAPALGSGWRSRCPDAPARLGVPLTDGQTPLLAVGAGLPARALSETPWFTGSGRLVLLGLHGVGEGAHRGVWMRWRARPPTGPAVWVLDRPEGALVGRPGALSPAPSGPVDALRAALSRAAPYPGAPVVLVPGAAWTVQDLVRWCAARPPQSAGCVLVPGSRVR